MEAMQPRCHETFTWRRDVNGLELDAQTLEDHGDAVLGVLDLQKKIYMHYTYNTVNLSKLTEEKG